MRRRRRGSREGVTAGGSTRAVLRFRNAVKESVAYAATEKSFAAPGSVRDENRFAGDVVVGVVDEKAEGLVDVLRGVEGE